ncbi:pantothenate synthetase [Rhodovulum imhoffii]|uniref:Pantothenate synthetase n=1 Tax=Rhodovulum imhoffii TaxID=365340 RepID=A0A2T5BS03_9RHOB|nr:pantoate--beta-alanine ligase [Rhodovulum imhoffii]MBK5933159.1 pantoate--beta-alanine ligase [Rhodovulum imhoffii]PTN02099.1 pantothenate synthetase [Rhodovulum imhoffii]
MNPPILREVAELRAVVAGWRASGACVGVVPTMGALHEGHLGLVRAAKARADRVIVTIFVNPRQFDNPDDLAKYPRSEVRDAQTLAPLAVDAIYAPDTAQMYPEGFATTISVSGIGEGLCGAHRPGHFDGVATVVAKLLLQTGADMAFFGEKDFQQLMLVRRLVRDLDIPAEIVGCPIARAEDGLALSSRNARLSRAGRATAPALYRALSKAVAALCAGAPVAGTLEIARAEVLSAGFSAVEYLELRSAQTLAPLDRADRPARVLAAAHLDGVRLIDNAPVPV